MTINNTTQQLNSFTAPFNLKDLLDSYKDATSISINCHHVGTIQSFNSADQTATVTINYTKTFFKFSNEINTNVPEQINYPVLMKCPVICLGGGGSSLTFPIVKGDECLVLFNDRSLDNWFQSGTVTPLNSPRLHSISDGIVLVGIRSAKKVLSGYSSTDAVLQNGTTKVGVGPSKINIANNSTTLNTLLQSLISDLNTLITAVAAITVTGGSIGSGTSGPPVNAAAITAVSSSLSTLSTQISGLLQ